MRNDREYNKFTPFLLLTAFAIFLAFCVDLTGETLCRSAYFFMIISFAIVAFVFRRSLPKDAVIWTMIGGVVVKASYILYTAIWTRQHDVISFGVGEGHAAYMEYILEHKALPDFDPRLVWAFFQPPLHHFICAVWMWFGIRLKIAERQIQESIQVLTLFYMCTLMIMIYFICKELYLSKKATLITMLIVSFHPIFTLLSGSINNDALSTMFTAVALYIAIIWFKQPKMSSILLLALSIGLGMAAKLSAGLVAPGIGIMMLYKAWIDRNNIKKYVLQFIAFGIVVFPIGLWWSVRNMIRFNMPINYIPEVGDQLVHPDMFSRILDIRMTSVYPELLNNGSSYDEYNVILAMIKTSLFGEANFSGLSRWIAPFAIILFVTYVIIMILEIVAMVRVIANREGAMKLEHKLLLGVSVIVILAGYFSFALSYNNFSAQDFRYGALSCAIMAIFLGVWNDRLEMLRTSRSINEGKKKAISFLENFIFAVAILFAISSAAVYILVGFN